MDFPGIVNESELDLLIDEILNTIPSNNSESYYSSSSMDSYPNVNSSYGFDNQRAQIDNHYSDNAYLYNQKRTSDDLLYNQASTSDDHLNEEPANGSEQAFNSSEQTLTTAEVPYKEVMTEKEREAMFEDAFQILNELTDCNGDVANENSCPDAVLPDVNPSHGGVANEVCSNERSYDVNNVGNTEIIVPTELETFNLDMEGQLDDLIAYLCKDGKENNSGNPN